MSTTASELATATRRRPGVPMGDPPDPGSREPSVLPGTGELVGSPDPRPQPTAGPVRDGVTLNLVEASIPAAAKAVLGDMLRYNYTISDKVKGIDHAADTAAGHAARGCSRCSRVALQAQGAAIVATDGTCRILPIEEALAAGAPIQSKGATGRGAVGMTTQVVQLRHVPAPDMERLLKSVAPQSSGVRIDPQRNLVILTGTRNDLCRIERRHQRVRRRLDARHVVRDFPDRVGRSRGDRPGTRRRVRQRSRRPRQGRRALRAQSPLEVDPGHHRATRISGQGGILVAQARYGRPGDREAGSRLSRAEPTCGRACSAAAARLRRPGSGAGLS